MQAEQRGVRDRLDTLSKLAEYADFRELDWYSLAAEIARLEDERRRLESASDLLRQLNAQLEEARKALEATEAALQEHRDRRSKTEQRQSDATALRAETQALLDGADLAALEPRFERLAGLREEALGRHQLTVESCDNREQDLRQWLQGKIDAGDLRLGRLRVRIIQSMMTFKEQFPLETAEFDANVEAGFEYRGMLDRLRADDLPRFEARFKELLNENTIREVANFQSQLARERETIKDRIARINESLGQIDYNPGRYIRLEALPAPDADIRDFQAELRACTEGALTGSEDAQYSEAKFLQVKGIVERLRGREGTAEQDRRWTARVTDVRNWFVFAASERCHEDDSDYEHYSDSGGKSGGQKEKLAYTILAASLAYQFGLEVGTVRSRTFRFVVIDEAFGRGSDESTQYGLRLFSKLNLQLLIVTPLQKIHVIEPYVASVGFVHIEDDRFSRLRNLSIEEYREEKARLAGVTGADGWTTPADLRRQVQRLWDRGVILASVARDETPFPKRLTLRRPGSTELRDRFDEVRAWTAALRSMPHLRLAMREVRHRVSGTNSLPHEAWVDTVEDAATLIRKQAELGEFRRLVDQTRARRPALLAWVAKRPLRALRLAGDWPRLLDVVGWLGNHPRPGVYLRQMDVPGVHSKFVEAHRGVLGELLDLALSPESIDASAPAGATGFARRYGFREKPERIRFRVLDPALSPLPASPEDAGGQDIALDVASFATFRTGASRVFITENEINFLAFPPVQDAMVIFGADYGFERLGRARWLEELRLHYWGDIDTHGYAILDALRTHFGHVESFLMDRTTLLAFESLWGTEDSPVSRDLPRLTTPERALYDDLRDNRFGRCVRLEQERIGFGWVEDALARL